MSRLQGLLGFTHSTLHRVMIQGNGVADCLSGPGCSKHCEPNELVKRSTC